LASFVKWYNKELLYKGIKFVTPTKRDEGLDKEILENRHKVYQEAKQRHPVDWAEQIEIGK
jgi:putative transposase